MTSVLEFHYNLLFGFLVYGLAFFAMSLAIFLEWRSDSDLPLTRALPALALFALLQGLVEWVNVLALLRTDGLGLTIPWTIEVARTGLLVVSYLSLLLFGLRLLGSVSPERRWTRQLVLPLLLAWIAGSVADAYWEHPSLSDWTAVAESLAGYLLVIPAGLLSVWGLHKQKKRFEQLDMPQIGMDCIWAGAILAFYFLLTGLVPPRAPFPPASLLNYGSFLATVGMPVQVFQAILAIGMALFILRVLRAYQEELQRRVNFADEERYAAQQEALEAHRKAAEQLRQGNEELERRVLDRTHELERRQRESEALYQIATEITAHLKLEVILSSVAEKARQLLRADLSTVMMVEEGQGPVRFQAINGAATEAFSRLLVEPGEGLAGTVVRTGQPVITDDYMLDPNFPHSPEINAVVALEGLRGHLAVPMKTEDQLLGVLCVASRGGRRFGDDDRRLLERLAVIAALAVQNSRLHARAQQAAVLEERERLGREIHDGLAQTLGCLGMMARAAQDRLESVSPLRVRSDLQEMERLAHEAYCDAREAILGLRVSAYGGPELPLAMQEYLSRYSEQCGLVARMEVGEGWPTNLPADAELQIMRIVQEALSNTRKHAEAQQVFVQLTFSEGCARVVVQDDGRGFEIGKCGECDGCRHDGDCDGCNGCHFGMQTMRERAAAMGATLKVESAPGNGTRITIRLPFGDTPQQHTTHSIRTVA